MNPTSRRAFLQHSMMAISATGLAGYTDFRAQLPAEAQDGSVQSHPAWFADRPFNMLVDYYPEVPFRPYGLGATPENVLPVLRELQLGCIIIYAKGHSGTTTFPSSLKTEHPMFGARYAGGVSRLHSADRHATLSVL